MQDSWFSVDWRTSSGYCCSSGNISKPVHMSGLWIVYTFEQASFCGALGGWSCHGGGVTRTGDWTGLSAVYDDDNWLKLWQVFRLY